jgi:hypothetical protein
LHVAIYKNQAYFSENLKNESLLFTFLTILRLI